MPDVMIAQLDEVIEAQPHNDDALPVADRASRLAEIEGEIALLENREEYVIERAGRGGVVIPRRDGASPASILGVQIAKPATARAA